MDHLPSFSIFLACVVERRAGRAAAGSRVVQWRVETRHVQRAGAMSCRSASPGAVVEFRSLGFSPISFTSGWAAALALPLESLARHRGVGWKSPSGWESHKCVNKCNDQSSLLWPGNSGLLWMAGGGIARLQVIPVPHLQTGASGKEKLWKRFFPRKTRVRCHATAIYVSSEQCND